MLATGVDWTNFQAVFIVAAFVLAISILKFTAMPTS